MSHMVDWMIEGRVIMVQGTDVVTAPEMEEQIEQVRQLLDTGQPPVHLIVDTSKTRIVPRNLMTIRNIRYRHPSIGQLFFVGSGRGLLTGTIIARLNGINSRNFNTLSDALLYLERLDLTLPVFAR